MSRLPSKLYSNSSLVAGTEAVQRQQVKIEMEETEAMEKELEEILVSSCRALKDS